ncbi:saccharopine dehydrogenase NADP-binding domain-containing protein [Microbacterium trichothecenolyticum]|uniref:saccharopine dehydrogenase family protein n=1 Tax=Microbacterium trichothecenolyticum TaxID=69370 RepID=UPI001C6E7DF7|nr:saccharopine dehydrogenase NADP-binding domain-containing protein [Microbacterium trichothecenolyticum]MBW9119620.1 saccharopine dehydrogenase NADP-binding domain-containing protein [Microbacterium trichothecenolyticum]
MRTNDRDHDIVLLGASGFVGRYTARHLARSAPDGVRIAIAGRSRARLNDVKRELGIDWPAIQVDTSDEAGVARVAASTAVIATTVGPYLRYGTEVAAACARTGTSYADLSGESIFVARSIERNHAVAETTGTKIVHSCGFDSIPSDLGVGLAHAAAGGVPIVAATLKVRSLRGGISGGTIDSLRQQLKVAKTDASARRLLANPYALTPGPSARLPGQAGSGWGKVRGSWQAPFVMGSYNQQIVQRSNYLTGWSYGQLMQYREVVATGGGPAGFARAGAIALGTASLVGALGFPPTRAVLDRVLPSPGGGPSPDVIEHGRFALDVDIYPVEGQPVRTRVTAPYDPGYGGTGVMLAESALSLVLDNLSDRAGVLTPMVAMGEHVADRLRTHGFTLEVGPLPYPRS